MLSVLQQEEIVECSVGCHACGEESAQFAYEHHYSQDDGYEEPHCLYALYHTDKVLQFLLLVCRVAPVNIALDILLCGEQCGFGQFFVVA